MTTKHTLLSGFLHASRHTSHDSSFPARHCRYGTHDDAPVPSRTSRACILVLKNTIFLVHIRKWTQQQHVTATSGAGAGGEAEVAVAVVDEVEGSITTAVI